MGDNPDEQEQSKPSEPPAEPPAKDDLGDGGKKALDAERAAARAAKKQVADLEAKLKEYEDRDKSETEKLSERVAAAEKRAADAEAKAARAEVAIVSKLTEAQASRLRGTTREELLADAEAMKAEWATPDQPAPPPSAPDLDGRPKPSLPGAEPPAGEGTVSLADIGSRMFRT